jgi:hypothetical protein
MGLLAQSLPNPGGISQEYLKPGGIANWIVGDPWLSLGEVLGFAIYLATVLRPPGFERCFSVHGGSSAENCLV